MMLEDRYGNALSTTSHEARDAYVEGVDIFFAMQVGVEDALNRAIEADPNFALAHIALARQHQTAGRISEIAPHLTAARSAKGLTEREAGQVDALGTLLEGRGAEAYGKIRAHLAEYPRDAMVVQPCIGVFGLIGFSGQHGREAEQLAFTSALLPQYGDDWWMLGGHAFAEMEAGRLLQAETTIEKSLAGNPLNANAAHYRSHLYYENGEAEAGAAYIDEWVAAYDRRALLHTHIAWHSALWALERGNADQVWAIYEADVAPDAGSGPALNVMTDSASLLFRAELMGLEAPDGAWERVSAFAQRAFPKTGIAFGDLHAGMAHAMAGDGEALSRIITDATGPAADIVRSAGEGFGALARQNWSEAIAAFSPIMSEHERFGGSRAQRDLLEFGLAAALLRNGQGKEARRMLTMRRPLAAPSGAVIGLN